MYPIATFASDEATSSTHTDMQTTGDNELDWLESMLNPRNRPDSLTPARGALWRMDGCQSDGHRLFITPLFALNKPPQRVDVYLSDEDEYRLSRGLRRVLEPDKSMTVPSKESWRVPLSQHILRGLEHWSRAERTFEKDYTSLPFGSYIAVETIRADQTRIRMHLVPRYETEREWVSAKGLAELWSRPGLPTIHWPEVIDLRELQLVGQPHEAISIVRIPTRAGREATTLFAFKSVLDDLRFMYHELWRLLTLPPHPNVIGRPLFIVTSRSRFGAKEGVCGFVLEYVPGGTMRDLLVRSRINRRIAGDGRPQLPLSVTDKFRMAHEITSALIHIQIQGTFYSGIKYTNVVMQARRGGLGDGGDGGGEEDGAGYSALSPVLIDFDQHNGRFIWTPPEIHHVVHVEYLANAFGQGHMHVPQDIRARAAALMRTHFPLWRSEEAARKGGYQSCWDHGEPSNGFCAPWLALSPEERDRAQVYMLGRLLWHLFEEVGAIDHCLHIEVFREAGDFDDSRPAFPQFSEQRDVDGRTPTPESIRRLIRRCTAGAPEWRGKAPALVYSQGRLWPYGMEEGARVAKQSFVAERDAQEAMRSWWVDELQDAERFIMAYSQQRTSPTTGLEAQEPLGHDVLTDMRSRPLLQEVLQALEQEEGLVM